jgi:hypothetical protein
MAATTLLLAGLAVSTFAWVLDFFLFEGEAGDDVFLLRRDFFSIDTVFPPGSNLAKKKSGNSHEPLPPFPCRLDPRSE